MKKIFYLVASVIIITTMTGCKEQKSEAWYKSHPNETYETYSECLESGEASDNCEFSYRAALMFARSSNPDVNQKFIDLFKKKEEIRKKSMK
jgi:hypothetical protein